MRTPLKLQAKMSGHIMREKLRGNKRIPLVLMLEPLHACNLTCEGCGRIIEYKDSMTDRMSLEQCFEAAEVTRAPVVSVCGGEPLIYREIDALIDGLIERGKYIYLCTNAMFLDRFLPKHEPCEQLSITVHMDGMRELHDKIVERQGVWDLAIENIKLAKQMGFHVTTNTTIFRETTPEQLEELFTFLTYLGVDGLIASPAFAYEAFADDPYMFGTKDQIHEKFQKLLPVMNNFNMLSTPQYMSFLAGEREYPCSPWGNITRNPKGWKGPCYAITNDHYETYQELLESTDWEYYAQQKDPRCANCKMHSGFEASVVFNMTMTDMISMMRWQLAA
ncbi:MAG: adenosyl-hopene transferase HpnH [Chrysiogenetes bacterium]|nr:adenosyl-hopene transferase HpnH [Chrysiogenetes bacterium]